MNSDFKIGERTFRVAFADITDLTVDAIVSSDDANLSMGGGVSAAISERGGSLIRQEAKRLSPLPFGGVAVTSAGALPARYVFHAAVIDYAAGRAPDAL